MNERIQELACKAGMRHPVMGEIVYSSFSHEEFAELIVRECINEIHVADVGDIWLKGKDYYLDKVAEHIEKHFGVQNER